MADQSDITIVNDPLLLQKSKRYVLLSGTSNQSLAEDISKILKTPVYYPIKRFADSEANVQIPVNIRRSTVVIIQSTCPPDVDGYFVELLLMIDAAKRASAKEIIIMIPYFGYSRQDRKDRPRVPISASVLGQVLEFAGADKICTIDIHSDQEQGFVRIPWDNLYSSFSLVPEIEKLNLNDLVVASGDKGGVPMATAYARRLNAHGIAIVYKERDVNTANQSHALGMIGDVKGKNVLIVDDMIDTAGTLCHAAELLVEKGAKSITAAATHGIFSKDALQRIEDSPIEKLFITDTIPVVQKAENSKKIAVVSVAPLLSEAIQRILTGESISEKLILR